MQAYQATITPPRVRLSDRLTRAAGVYRPPDDIALSRHFLRQHGEAALVAILRHEVAHHIVRGRYAARVRPHGPEFRAVADLLGAPRHAPAFAAPRTVHLYRCPACGATLLRGRRLTRGRRYSCGHCSRRYDARFALRYLGSQRDGPDPHHQKISHIPR